MLLGLLLVALHLIALVGGFGGRFGGCGFGYGYGHGGVGVSGVVPIVVLVAVLTGRL